MNYWQNRALEYEKDLYKVLTGELEPELAAYFKESLKDIEKELAAFYGKFAAQNGLTYAAAQKLLRGSEFKEWRMSLKEYVALSHIDSKILLELNTLAARSKVTRLESLYTETLKSLQNLGEKYETATKDFLKGAYSERYTRGLNDLTAGKLDLPVAKVQPTELEKVLAQKWRGGNYSTRIWKNTENLAKVLKTTMIQGFHRGLSVQKLSKIVTREMSVSYKNAERLVRTELNFLHNQAAAASLKAAGLSEYEYLAAAGPRTCSTCSNLNGTIHLLKDLEVGTNAPPMHPRCRCTICATGKISKNSLRSLPEVQVIAEKLNKVIDKYVVRKSKWSGKVIESSLGYSAKAWNCDILACLNNFPDIAILHELLHARSVSYYGYEIWKENKAIEEASVQLLTQEIATRENVPAIKSAYDEWANILREYNRTIEAYSDDLQFAKRLLRVPLGVRVEWLLAKARKLKSDNLEDLLKAQELIEKLNWEDLTNERTRISRKD